MMWGNPFPLPTFSFNFFPRRSKKSIRSPNPKKCSSAVICFVHATVSPVFAMPPLIPFSDDTSFPSLLHTSIFSVDLFTLTNSCEVFSWICFGPSETVIVTGVQSYFTTIHGSFASNVLFQVLRTRNMPAVQNSILRFPLDVENKNWLPALLKLLYVPMFCWEEQIRTANKKLSIKENLFSNMQSKFHNQNKKN